MVQEARNGLLQFDYVLYLVEQSSTLQRIQITPHLISELNRLAIQGIRRSAGSFRRIPVSISNTAHQPPPPGQIPIFVDEMCRYANDNWQTPKGELDDALHVSAYLMWRLNWIHPFRDGNGRTSRALSYLALSVRLGHLLPGSPTIADQIVENKLPYYEAIDEADAAWNLGTLNVTKMENLIRRLLTLQLSSIAGASAPDL